PQHRRLQLIDQAAQVLRLGREAVLDSIRDEERGGNRGGQEDDCEKHEKSEEDSSTNAHPRPVYGMGRQGSMPRPSEGSLLCVLRAFVLSLPPALLGLLPSALVRAPP